MWCPLCCSTSSGRPRLRPSTRVRYRFPRIGRALASLSQRPLRICEHACRFAQACSLSYRVWIGGSLGLAEPRACLPFSTVYVVARWTRRIEYVPRAPAARPAVRSGRMTLTSYDTPVRTHVTCDVDDEDDAICSTPCLSRAHALLLLLCSNRNTRPIKQNGNLITSGRVRQGGSG